jgi:hypothetical protein
MKVVVRMNKWLAPMTSELLVGAAKFVAEERKKYLAASNLFLFFAHLAELVLLNKPPI